MAFFHDSHGDAPTTESEPFSFNESSWAFQDTPPYEFTAPFYQDDWTEGTDSPGDGGQQVPSEIIAPENPAGTGPPAAGPMGMFGPVQSQPSLPAGALNTLTDAQRHKLQKIAMPAHLQYHSPKSEPSPDSRHSFASSPEDSQSPKAGGRKRKSPADDDDDDDDDELDGHQPVKKTAHNMIEKRYRTNLNDKIADLRDAVPSLRIMSKSARGEDTTGDREELHGLTPAHKLNKATILSKATEYIRHLEKRNNRLMDDHTTMQARIAAFEKLFMAGAMNGGGLSPVQQPPTPMQYPQESNGFGTSPIHTPNRADPPGMIQVPEDLKRIIAAQVAAGQPYPVPQQHYRPNPSLVRQQQIQQQQQAQTRGWNGGPYFGKLMVGTLAGLMVVEAVRETEQSDESPEGRGLFAMPLQLLRPLVSSLDLSFMGYSVAGTELLFYLKLGLLLCSLCWVVFPHVFAGQTPSPKAEKQGSASIEAAPSLASPIQARRQAWLTSVQTVWVPRHNFFLEAAALGLKTLKLSLRNLTGDRGYQALTGLTEDQEVARVKAWTIALDAQLAGGDVEISKSRLTLTLLASGTLPDTPLHLMMKALHVRVLLWEIGITGNRLGISNTIASKLARRKWTEATQLYRLLTQLRRGGQEQSDNDLPSHLAVLLEQDADDVLNPGIVQRAHNLAWNRPTGHNAIGVTDGMDLVVDDEAVRSPMDAVAAWFSSLTLQTALANSLLLRKDKNGETGQFVEEKITLAIRTAPIGSVAQNRALVARAVLFGEKRGANIAAVIQALGPATACTPSSNTSASGDVTPPVNNQKVDLSHAMLSQAEIYMCLQCAKVIAHLQRYAPPNEPVSVYPLIDNDIYVMNETSLLGFAAAFAVMEHLARHRYAAEACSSSLERLSGSLRIWTGRDRALDPEVKQELVERCLDVTRNVVGMNVETETDTGYGSMSSENESESEFSQDEEESEETTESAGSHSSEQTLQADSEACMA